MTFVADETPAAHVLNAGQDGKLMRDYLIKNKISVGWAVGNQSEDRYGDFRKYSAKEIREDNPSGDDTMPVVKFLGVHSDSEKNIQIGDDVIVYAPEPAEVVVGTFTVCGEAEYVSEPIQLTDEDHYYYRDVVPKPWSKPVDYDEFKKYYSGKSIIRPSTLQPFYGDLTNVADAIKSASRADIEPEQVIFQRN